MLHIYIGYRPNCHTYLDRPEHGHLRVDHGALADEIMNYTIVRSARTLSVWTDAETILLRIRRRIVEGTFPLDLLQVTFTSKHGEETEITVTPEGEVVNWPDGWFSEDFQEVKAMARARKARWMHCPPREEV